MSTALDFEDCVSFNPLFIYCEPKLFDVDSIDVSPSGKFHFDQTVSRYGAKGKSVPVKPLALGPSNRVQSFGYQQIEDLVCGTLCLQDTINVRVVERNSA